MITADRTTAVRRNDYFCSWLFMGGSNNSEIGICALSEVYF